MSVLWGKQLTNTTRSRLECGLSTSGALGSYGLGLRGFSLGFRVFGA